jgi:predicted permease
MREWWNRFLVWAGVRRGVSDDLAEEMRSHFDMEVARQLERGLSPSEARFAAHRRFGNSTFIAERARETWGFPSLDSFLQDVRYGLRALRRSPGFSAVVILTLALGIGVNTSVYSVVRSVLLKPLPYPHSERLVWFGETAGKAEGISVTWGNFLHWRADNHTFDEMAAFQFTERTLTGRNEPVVTTGLTVTAPYFPLLGMRPLLGRFFGPAEDRAGAPPVVVLNHRFWSEQLGGDPQIVGTTLILNGSPFEVIGVAPPLWESWRVDYYLPLGAIAGNAADRRQHGSIRMLGRLRPGVTLTAARADLDGIMRHLSEVDPGPENEHRSYGEFWAKEISGDMRGTLLMLLGATGLILVIACANVASLLLARNTARTGELALRRAVGAGRLRLVRQLLTETSVITAFGGLTGIGLALGTLRLLVAYAPKGIPRLAETAMDVPALFFAFAISLAAGVLAGLAPVIAASRTNLTAALKEASRSAGFGKRRQFLRNALVIAEVALTFVLAFGSGLLLRSLIAAQRSNPGFDPRNAFAFTLQLPSKAYKSLEAVSAFHARLLADLCAIPGVAGASTVHCSPDGGDCGDWFYSISGQPAPSRNDVPVALFNTAGAGYFQLMRIPMLQGREFNDADRAEGAKVAVVNETFARRWWPNRSAIGQLIKAGRPYQDGDLLQIVGVAGDLRQFGLDAQPAPEIFRPYAQERERSMTVVVRTAGPPESAMAAVRGRLAAIDRNLPVRDLETFKQSLGAGLARRRFTTLLLTLFAGLAMLLAGIGIYGLLSYWVNSREGEIAIRLALGARPRTILGWTTLQALRLAAIGTVLGLLGSWTAARTLEGLVFGVPPRNAATMISAAVLVMLLAFAAAALPASRAARIDAARRLHCA